METAEELTLLKTQRDTFFDLLLATSEPRRRVNSFLRESIKRRNFTMFCMYHNINGENKKYSFIQIGKKYNITGCDVFYIIKDHWKRLEEAGTPFTKENLESKLSRLNKLLAKQE